MSSSHPGNNYRNAKLGRGSWRSLTHIYFDTGCSNQGQPRQAAQDCIQSCFEYVKDGDYTSWATRPNVSSPSQFKKRVFLMKLVFQLVPIVLFPLTKVQK